MRRSDEKLSSRFSRISRRTPSAPTEDSYITLFIPLISMSLTTPSLS